MWLINLFTKTKDNGREESINKDKINEESINISLKHVEEQVINDLKNRVEKVKKIHTKLKELQNKQDLHLNNNTTNTLSDKDEQCASTNKNENNYKIEDILRIIPVIENNLQSLTEKVSCLFSLFDAKQLNAKTVTASNSLNKMNGVVDKTIQTNKDTSPGLVTKKNKKMRKNKRSFITKKKYSYQKVKIRRISTKIINKVDQKDQVMNEENVPSHGVKLIDQLTNLDGQLESFFTKIQSVLTQCKIDQVKEKSEIMINLSKLDDKININYTKVNKLMSNIEQLIKLNDTVNHVIPNPIDILQTQQSVTIDTPISNTNINGTCTSNRCVCKLIDNTNISSAQIINSHDAKKQMKYGDIILCEFLKVKLTLERKKRDKHQQIAQVNQFSNQIDAKTNSLTSLCSKQSNLFSNICDGNQIDIQKSSQLLVCSKKSNLLKNNDRRQENSKNNHLTVCPKKSVHHFFKFGIENHTTSNQQNTKKSVREKNKICDFLSSQPIPEWIRLDENLVKSDNVCCKAAAKSSPSNCTLNVSKSFNIERIVNDSHDKNDIVYEITQKPDVPK
ncbi:metacaspase-2-like [Metopolophium dirhodum]|uniref:metacaspase-2-like n=1 Tax=Metopolophium dirhodum TaxID=44670 RepID=UPI00298FCD71|nr:metacaspase-2-like [Metopolophium dirhodum]